MAVIADRGEALAYFIGEAPIQRENFWFQGQLTDILSSAQSNAVHCWGGLVTGVKEAVAEIQVSHYEIQWNVKIGAQAKSQAKLQNAETPGAKNVKYKCAASQ